MNKELSLVLDRIDQMIQYYDNSNVNPKEDIVEYCNIQGSLTALMQLKLDILNMILEAKNERN